MCGGTLFGGTHAASSAFGSKSSAGRLSSGRSCFGVVKCKSTRSIGCSCVLFGARMLPEVHLVAKVVLVAQCSLLVGARRLPAALCIKSHHRNSRR